MCQISVIIVNYKAPEMTKRCILSLNETTFADKEIILIDNSENNIGLAAAQNKGASKAKGQWLFFLNNDTLVKPNIFDELLKAGRWLDVIGCKMFTYDWKKELDSAISVDRFGCPAGMTGEMFYPDGAIFIRKYVFDKIGGFDEKLFLYGEDRDLCWRVHLAGFRVGTRSSAHFAHNSSCVVGGNYFRRKVSEQNIIRSMLKNYSLLSLVWIIPQYVFWSILELGLMLFTHPRVIWKSYIPAYWWNIVNLVDTLKARKKIVRKVNDRNIPFSKVIGKFYVLQTQGIPKWNVGRY